MAVNLNPAQTGINKDWIKKNLEGCKGFKEIKTNEYRMCSPLRDDDKEPSFTVNAEKGAFYDFATDARGTLTELAKLLNVEPPSFAGASDKSTRPVKYQPARQESRKVDGMPQGEKSASKNELKELWNACSPNISDHPYIKKKHINPNTQWIRVCTFGMYAGWLIVPAVDLEDNFRSFQYISGEGAKRNHAGSDIKGLLWMPSIKGIKCDRMEKEIILCEGIATAATVKELRPQAYVVCTFSSMNMPEIARQMKAKYPEYELIVASDADDVGEKSYKEITQGQKATDKTAGRLPIDALKAIPRKKLSIVTGVNYPKKTDWNDIAVNFGKEFAAGELNKLINQERIFKDILAQVADESKLTAESSASLFAVDDEPTQWAVDGLVPEGLTVLGGHPKKGKSFLALQMSLAVASGEDFMGLATKQGRVLHMALEDGRARTKRRIKALGGRDKADDAYFAFSCPRFNENGLRELLNFINDVEPVLIVVDVWNIVKPPTQKATGKNAYESDHEAASILNKLGTATHTAILMVHHLRKGAASSEIMTEGLSGSMGLPAAASAILTLLREDESQHGILHRSGRDYEDDKPIHIHFSRGMTKDGEPFGWRAATPTEIDENSEPKNKNDEIILNILKPPLPERFKDGMTIKQIAARTENNMKRATLYKRLKYLVRTGEIRKTDDEKYQLIEPEEIEKDYAATIRDFENKFPQKENTHLDIQAIIANGRAKAAEKVNKGQENLTLPEED